MAGRGRGRSLFTFNVDSLGFGKGEALPCSAHTPSPLFPVRPMLFRPVPLHTGEEVDYMLALKQELRASSKNLPFHIRPGRLKKDVDRYSDKYQTVETDHSTWNPDWSLLPKELCIKAPKLRKSKAKPLKHKVKATAAKEELIQKLETLEKSEETNQSDGEEDEEKKKTGEEEEESGEGEELNEEEFEEETDYIMSYFDNGEDFGGDSDDNMDEATY